MASSPRDAEREEERRLNMRTLAIASAASAAAAAVTSQLWIAGTWIAAAITPVLVALISEALHRPTERVARARTTRRAAPGAATTSPKLVEPNGGPIRVYRQPGPQPSRRRIALGVVAATGALAFVIGIVALTTLDLVSGGSVGKGSGRTTLLGGGGDGGGKSTDQQPAESGDESTSQPDEPADEPTSTEPTSTEPPEDEPSETAPVPPPEPAPREPEQPAVP